MTPSARNGREEENALLVSGSKCHPEAGINTYSESAGAKEMNSCQIRIIVPDHAHR